MNAIDVLIAGAGPTGLTLACDLARWGVTARVIDDAAASQQGSRGFALKPRTLDVFDDLGLADRITAAGAVSTPIRFHLGHSPLFDLAVPPARPTARRPHPNAVSLPQWRTEELLRERLAELGAKVDFGHRLTGFTADVSGVTANVEHDGQTRTVRAAYLVGADGGRSFVRRHLGIPFAGTTDEDSRALLADVRVRGLDRPGSVHLWMTGQGLLAMRPTPRSEMYQVVASLDRDAEPSLENLRRFVEERTGRTDITVSDPTWLSVWRYNLRIAERYRAGRVFLAGDAAHVHSPFGAYGMNTGIQDAYNLGWKLALALRGAAPDSLLDSYEAERLPVARAILADSDRRFAAATPPAWLRPFLRLLVKPVLARQIRADREDYPSYRVRGHRRHGPAVGDPAPDGPLPTGGTLFDLFRGPHFTVLNSGGQFTAPPAPHIRVHDVAGRVYGLPRGTIVVVRPDGYLGLITRDSDAVRDYLRLR